MKIPKFNYSSVIKTIYLTEGNNIISSFEGVLKTIDRAILLDNGKILIEGYLQQLDEIPIEASAIVTTVDEREKILEFSKISDISTSNKRLFSYKNE